MSVTLRPYQEQAISSVLEAWETHRATLVVSPTGTGKTVMFCALAAVRKPTGRVLVLAHREELVYQAVAKLVQAGFAKVGVEMAERRAFRRLTLAGTEERPDVVVASVATLSNAARLEDFPCDEFTTVIVDEAQHAVAATWKSLLNRFSHAKVVGFTATPDRADERGLREVFEHVAFEMDLRTAIEENYLVPIRQKRIEVKSLDLSSVKTTAGDLDEHDLERVLTEEGPLHEMAMPIAELAEERPTLIFAASVKHALALERVLRRYTGEGLVSTVSGDMPKDLRKATIDAFQRGKIRFLVNCALLTEGFDAPHTSCIAMCRPTKSRPLYAQIVGRGTRLAPGKTDCLVLDFKGNADQHKLVSVVDLLGRELTIEAKQRVEQALACGEGNVLSALQHEENRAHAEAEAARLTVKAVYSETEVDWSGRGPRKAVGVQRKSRSGIAEDKLDPFRWFGLEREAAPSGWRATPCTEAQKSVLSRNGIDVRNLTRGDASDLIEEMTSRANKGLCTPRQAKFLAIFGRDTSVTFEQASTWIDQLKQRGRPGMRWK